MIQPPKPLVDSTQKIHTYTTHWIPILVILGLGLAIRLFWALYNDAYIFFTIRDAGHGYSRALAFFLGDFSHWHLDSWFLQDAQVPGPLQNLYYSFLYWINPSPVLPTILAAILSAFIPYVTYRVGSILFNSTIGFWAMAVHVFNPYAIVFTITLWNLTYFAILCPLLLWAFLKYTRTLCIRYVISTSFLLAGILQFHLLVLFLVPSMIIYLLWKRIRIPVRHIVVSALILMGCFIPYFIGDAKNDFENTKNILKMEREEAWYPEVFKIFTSPLFTSSNEMSRFLAGKNFKIKATEEDKIGVIQKKLNSELDRNLNFYSRFYGHFSIGIFLVFISLLVSLAAYILFTKFSFQTLRYWINQKRKRGIPLREAEPNALFLVLFYWVPILFFIPTGQPHYLRYVVMWYPISFILIAVIMNRWMLASIRRQSQSSQSTSKKSALVHTIQSFLFNIWVVRISIALVLLVGGYQVIAYNISLHESRERMEYPAPSVVELDALVDALVTHANKQPFSLEYPTPRTSDHETQYNIIEVYTKNKYGIDLVPPSQAEVRYIVVPKSQDAESADVLKNEIQENQKKESKPSIISIKAISEKARYSIVMKSST